MDMEGGMTTKDKIKSIDKRSKEGLNQTQLTGSDSQKTLQWDARSQ